jgi:hypothetical protein
MKSGNSSAELYDWAVEEEYENNIIYLRDYHPAETARPRVEKKNGGADTFWNLLFVGACLSVLVVLFLH